MQLGSLELSMFTDKKGPRSVYPVLSSRVKAAEARHLAPILADIWRDVHNDDAPGDRDVLALLDNLADLY